MPSSQGLFSSSYWPANEKARSAQEARRGHGQDTWPQLAEGVFHTMWHDGQHINLEEPCWGWTLLGNWLRTGRWVVSITLFIYSFVITIIIFFPLPMRSTFLLLLLGGVVLFGFGLGFFVVFVFPQYSPPSHWAEEASKQLYVVFSHLSS